jgi:hypothetical protein
MDGVDLGSPAMMCEAAQQVIGRVGPRVKLFWLATAQPRRVSIMRLLRHNLAHLAFGANMVCPQMRSTELGRHAKPGGKRFPRSPRHRRAVGGAHKHINASGRTLANQVMGAARVGYTRRASTCVCHQSRISSSATRRGLIRSLMRLASRSSASSGAAPACQGRRMALGPRSALRQSAAGKHR